MRRCARLAALLACCLGPNAAVAGDRWQHCTLNGGLFEYDGEALYEADGDARTEFAHEVVREITLSDEAGYCETKAGNRFNWANHIYAVHIQLAGTEGPFQLWALCEEGGSAIPASNEIDTTCVRTVHTKNKKLVPHYEDKTQ